MPPKYPPTQNNFQQVDKKLFGGGSTNAPKQFQPPQNISSNYFEVVEDGDGWLEKTVEPPQNNNQPPQNNYQQIWEIILRVTPPRHLAFIPKHK